LSPGNAGSKLRLASQPDKSHFFHHLNLCYTSHLFKCSFFPPSCLWLKSHSVTLRQSLENSRSPGRGVVALQQENSLGKKSPLLLSTTGHFSLDQTETRLQPSPPAKNVFRAPAKLKALLAVVRSFVRTGYGGSLDVYPYKWSGARPFRWRMPPLC